MSLLIFGLICWLVGKVAKIKILETVGMIIMVGAIILWGLSFVGINIPLPF